MIELMIERDSDNDETNNLLFFIYFLFSLTPHTVVLTKDGAIPAPALGEQTREQIKMKNQ